MAQVRVTIANSREMHKAERTRIEAEEAAGVKDTTGAVNRTTASTPHQTPLSHKGHLKKPPPAGKAGGKQQTKTNK